MSRVDALSLDLVLDPPRRMPLMPSASRDDAPCSRCGAKVGRPCKSPAGKGTRPHAERIAAAKAGRP